MVGQAQHAVNQAQHAVSQAQAVSGEPGSACSGGCHHRLDNSDFSRGILLQDVIKVEVTWEQKGGGGYRAGSHGGMCLKHITYLHGNGLV